MFITDFLRKQAIKKHGSKKQTCITPMKDIHSAVAFIDVEDQTFDECKNSLMAYFRERNIKLEVFFLDFRKLNETERLITSITNTILKKDLNFYGKPSQEKVDLMCNYQPDLFISLISKDDYAITYMASCCDAKFKIGRKQLPGDVFDMVIQDTTSSTDEIAAISEADSFKRMKEFLNKIK